MPELCIVTTCRGRLAQLQHSLPTFVVQRDAQCVVVDYDCPDECGKWVKQNYPQVKIVRAVDRPRLELSRARNLGAAAAKTPWICFVDANIRLAPEFSEKICNLLKPRHFYQAQPRKCETWGTAICSREDFDLVGGYDEVLQGYGKEDDDLYARLDLAGIRAGRFPGKLLSVIPPDGDPAPENHAEPDRELNESINHIYCRAKMDLMLLRRGAVPVQMREKLYQQVRQAVLGAHKTGQHLQIGVPFLKQQTRACGPLEARLLYTLPKPKGNSGA